VRGSAKTLARTLGNKPEPIPIGIEKAVLEACGFGGLLSEALQKGK
jgi:hypothetical protein